MVGQLRSRLASMEASGELEQAELNEPLRNELTMTSKGGYLSVWLHTDTGKGSWNVITGELQVAEPWFMSSEGIVELSGESMNLPNAVERFAAKIVVK
ncbi:hypothetical protein [Granulicella mallensis]|uniref:Uncharacterized protein n=1 Tax=Granulicella mallensis TaxID=940614 RepID=A0A7W8ECL8_9BACT|nr:hypothetical protein [Granulicella mallensis]MBB5065765.1 hypothetical protein [Granulicella mallensis]